MTEQIAKQQTLAQFEQQLRQGVEQGDPVACFQIVDHFERKALAQNQLEAQNRINLLMESSNKGVGAASILLGRWYLNGHYVPKDRAKAILFFEHAGNVCRDSYGFYQLAEMFQTGKGVDAQPEKGLAYLKKAVNMQNPDAIFTYATQVLTTNIEQAFTLLKDNYKKNQHVRSLTLISEAEQFDQDKVFAYLKSHHQNDPHVSSALAAKYFIRKNFDEARQLSEYAASQNHPIGSYIRALIELNEQEGSAEVAQAYMLKAAQFGHIEAAYRVALVKFQQADETSHLSDRQQIMQHGLQLFAQAAQAGFAPAQFSLGQCWLQGVGVEQNTQEGMVWIERAAQQGHIDAIFTLALNLPVDHEQHVPLLQTAAQAGHPKAMVCIGIYLQNQGEHQHAVQWFEHAKERQDVRAWYLLALAYRDGLGVEKDENRAIELFKESADFGDADAYIALYEAYRDGTGVRRNKKSQEKYLKLAQEAQHPAALDIDAADI